MWKHLMAHPNYGPYWKDCAADRWFEAPARRVPTLHVHGLWDQEDIYGAPAAYAALEAHDRGNDSNFFLAGPWYHGQHFADGSRDSLEEPRPIAPGQALEYRIPLPVVSHTFRPGHRLMVQVQSSWFPLYDRNPQTFVPSIMTAPPESYQAQRQRVHHSAAHATHLELPVERETRSR